MKPSSRMTVLLPWFICGLGALFYAYEYFLRITPSVMTTELMRFYHLHDGSLGNLSAYYYYIYTPMQLVAGLLMDRYGPRRLLTIATLCCVVGSALFAATPLLYIAEMGRLLVGFGSAFAFVGVLKLATIWLPRRYFAMFTGLATALGMIGAIAGDIALTALVNLIGWQQTAFMSALFGIILALMIGLFVRDHTSYDRKAQIAKANVSFKEAFAGLYEIILNPQMWIVGIIGGLLYIPASAFAELWGIPYLETAFNFSNQQAASAVSMVFAGWAIGGPIFGWISDHINRRNTPIAASGFLAGLCITAILFLPHLSSVMIYPLLFLFGALSGGQVIVFAVGREFGPPRLAGSSLAFTNMAVMLSGVVLQPFIGYALDRLWSGQMKNGVQLFTTGDYKTALAIIPVCLFIGALLAKFMLRETYCKQKGLEAEHLPGELITE